MRILFICGSLEPGKDGVGDYTWQLAKNLVKKNHLVSIISLNDKHAKDCIYTTIDAIQILRLPSKESWRKRTIEANKKISNLCPHLVSFQFVPYAFHNKGIPFELFLCLKKIRGANNWHIMFHEIWLGESIESTFKDKIIGFFQKQIIVNIIRSLCPKFISVTNIYYQKCFESIDITVINLPVFNNLDSNNYENNQIISRLDKQITTNREEYVITSFFGSIKLHRTLIDKIKQLDIIVKNENKKLVLTHIGRNNTINHFANHITIQTGIPFFVFGEFKSSALESYFKYIDTGLSTYPKILYEKSGSIAAMLNNGCPVILLRDSFEEDLREIPEVKELKEIENFRAFLSQDKSFANEYAVEKTTAFYLDMMATIL